MHLDQFNERAVRIATKGYRREFVPGLNAAIPSHLNWVLNSLADAGSICLFGVWMTWDPPAHCHFSEKIDVVVWSPTRPGDQTADSPRPVVLA